MVITMKGFIIALYLAVAIGSLDAVPELQEEADWSRQLRWGSVLGKRVTLDMMKEAENANPKRDGGIQRGRWGAFPGKRNDLEEIGNTKREGGLFGGRFGAVPGKRGGIFGGRFGAVPGKRGGLFGGRFGAVPGKRGGLFGGRFGAVPGKRGGLFGGRFGAVPGKRGGLFGGRFGAVPGKRNALDLMEVVLDDLVKQTQNTTPSKRQRWGAVPGKRTTHDLNEGAKNANSKRNDLPLRRWGPVIGR